MIAVQIRLVLYTMVLVICMSAISVASDFAATATTPTTEAAFEAAAADAVAAIAAFTPVAVALTTGALGLGIAVMAFNHVETGAYPVTTVGVRPRVTREAVRSDTPCTVCDTVETHERTDAAKAIVVGGAVLGTYDGVTNHYCRAHASDETMLDEPSAGADTEPAVATDGGTGLDDVADEIDTSDEIFTTMVLLLFLAPIVLTAMCIAAITDLLSVEI